MSQSRISRLAHYGLLVMALGACPLPSYALADNYISQLLGSLLFVVACGVAVIAALSALLALVAGSKATSQKSAVVAALALGAALLLKPAPSYIFHPEDATAQVPHPFGLVMQPDTTDTPTPIPALRDYDQATDSTHFDKYHTYISSMPQLAGGKTEAIQLVQKYMRYPANARQHEITGTVVVSFVVDEAGEVHNTRIVRGLGYGCDEEALRVVRGLPTFQNDAAAPVQLTWMFSFRPPELPVQ